MSDQIDVVEVRSAELRTGEVRVTEVGALQVRALHVGALEVRVGEVDVLQVAEPRFAPFRIAFSTNAPSRFELGEVGVRPQRAREVVPAQVAIREVAVPQIDLPGRRVECDGRRVAPGGSRTARRGRTGCAPPGRCALSAWSKDPAIAGRCQLYSMKLTIEDWSLRLLSTAFCPAHGETTSSGRRGPRPQRPCSPASGAAVCGLRRRTAATSGSSR